MVNNVHEIMQLLVENDPDLVFYPFPNNFRLPTGTIPVYTADHIYKQNGEERFEGRTGLKDYTGAIYSPRLGKPTWLNMVVGHNYVWEDIDNEELRLDLLGKGMLCFKTRVQDAKAMVAGILIGPHVCTFEFDMMEYLLCNHPQLKGQPLGVKLQPLKIFPTDVVSNDIPFTEKMVVVETLAQPVIHQKVIKQLISIFNGKKNTDVRPDGLNFTFLKWFGTKGCRNLDLNTQAMLLDGKREHDHIQRDSREVIISGLIDLDFPGKYNCQEISPRQILVTMRTSTDWDTTIFTQVNRTNEGVIVGICHENKYQEALRYSQFLYTLMKSKFGKIAEKWFDADTKANAKYINFNADKGIIYYNKSEHYFPWFKRYKQSPAVQRKMLKEGFTESDFTPLDDKELPDF